MERLYKWLFLKAVKGLGERSIKKLYFHFGDVSKIFEASDEEIESLIGKEKAKSLKEEELSFSPEEVIKVVEKESIGFLTLDDQLYPKRLREIEDPPPVLFYRGVLNTKGPFVAVIGTRNPEPYSVSFTKETVKELVDMGFGIVSGGARGIDFLSHKYAVEFGGYTLCVLGMGILHLWQGLEKVIKERGAFLSEFLPWENPTEYTFPRRNRIISGLSEAVFIIEAGAKSGALITAEHAIAQKRPVYVHVGIGKSPRWDGCIKLLNEGKAKFFKSPKEVFTGTSWKVVEEDGFLGLLTSPKTFEELLELTGMDARELSLKLSNYELEGKITRLGPYYRLA